MSQVALVYTKFLQQTSVYSATEASESSGLTHDHFTRYLASEKSLADLNRQLFRSASTLVDKKRGYLLADEIVIPKPHMPNCQLCGWHYSSTEGDYVWGISLLVLLWTDGKIRVPLKVIFYQKKNSRRDLDGKKTAKKEVKSDKEAQEKDHQTKNDIFRMLIKWAKDRGFRPEGVLFDSFFASTENLRLIDSWGWFYYTRIKKNRSVRIGKHPYQRLDSMDWSQRTTRILRAKDYGLARFVCVRATSAFLITNNTSLKTKAIIKLYRLRWQIEEFFKEVKLDLGLSKCQARKAASQTNHLFAVFRAFIQMETRRRNDNASIHNQALEAQREGMRIMFKC